MMAESLKNSVNFLLNNKESQANEYFFNDAIKKLKPEDRALPQVNINNIKLLFHYHDRLLFYEYLVYFQNCYSHCTYSSSSLYYMIHLNNVSSILQIYFFNPKI